MSNQSVLLSSQIAELWPIVVFFIILLIMLTGMLAISYFLGPRTNSRAKNTPYESGIISVNSPIDRAGAVNNKTRFTNHFFLYAIFFVIFDLEVIFLFSWVIAFDEVGWAGFIEASIFIIILLAALIYIWRIGALELTHRHLPHRLNTRNTQQCNTRGS